MNEGEIIILEMCVLMTYYHLQNDTGKNQISVYISLYLEQGIVISELLAFGAGNYFCKRLTILCISSTTDSST